MLQKTQKKEALLIIRIDFMSKTKTNNTALHYMKDWIKLISVIYQVISQNI